MADQYQTLQRRFGNARPGLQLIAVEDAAIPVTVLSVEVLAQEKKELPVAEEFALRFVSLGVNTPGEIAAYLGLDQSHVMEAVAAQLSQGHLQRTSGGERLALTPLGMEVSRNLAATQPTLRPLPIAFDRLTWTLADYHEWSLVSKKDAQEQGMAILPAARNARIGLDDVTPAGFNTLLKKNVLSKEGRIQVLRVHKVTSRKHQYLPVKLLVYGDQSRSELELAVCIDDDLAVDHGLALDRIEAVKQLRMTLGEPVPRPVLDEELERQRTTSVSSEATNAPGPENQVSSAGPVISSTGTTSPVRSVSVFEHADLLADALSSASQRLLIIAPWVRNAVVSTDFIANLEQRLRKGVEVTIAHGYGEDDSGSDEFALRRLSNLAARYPTKFTFVRVKNTHAKILIYDKIWINTSFNWLSFRGDPERTYRMEEGTLVSIPDRVDKAYARYIELIDQQRI